MNSLHQQCTRNTTKDILSIKIRQLQSELNQLLEAQKPGPINTSTPKCYEVKLNNYSWDETKSAMKLYISLQNVHEIPPENIICSFTEISVNLRVLNLENRNYHLPITNLCEEIDLTKSHRKIKTNMVIIVLIKKIERIWSCVTRLEKKMKETKSSDMDMDKNQDPEASLMNLMKKMYQEGDDEMKKTIAKTWTEVQQKRESGMPDFPSLS